MGTVRRIDEEGNCTSVQEFRGISHQRVPDGGWLRLQCQGGAHPDESGHMARWYDLSFFWTDEGVIQ